MAKLLYPVGCKIVWCGEEFEVLENHNDYYGTVKQGNKIISYFHFDYKGEKAVVIG